MRKSLYLVLLAVLAISPVHAIASFNSLAVIGLTADQRLIVFNEYFPSRTFPLGKVSGLTVDTALIGIDYRVQDGQLYGVGNAGGVYTLSTGNAAATLVNRLTIALEGTSFGVDFNPVADRLRVISNTGQNLRHNVNAGGVTLLDGTLTYTAPAPAVGVIGAAYTNNDLDANTATTLFDLDSTLDQIVLQVPANAGTLSPTGKLTVDIEGPVGFDIYSTVRRGATVHLQALATLATPVNGFVGLYSIQLLTGKATLRGAVKSPSPVIDIAIPLNQL